ncbi:hypothetical protein CK203_099235 [Vitis vinifera]|uniref:Integrase catalytic domain-containing protein n=1 Tax=Vitis vinifera TaxID=29760 RepID=A0A438CGU3_VITVI|nr:hypothetical protein CK203_099235 [Vitis vinifera]
MQIALRQNYDVFAWAHSDMKGIHPSIASHKLNVLPTARPIRQSQRGIEVSPDQIKAVIEHHHPGTRRVATPHRQARRARRFIARFTDELRPFFLAIRKAGTNGWTDNSLCYSAALTQEQKPIYYVSRALADVEPASRSSRSGVRLLLQSPTGEHLEQAIRLGFPASNNETEYEAILSGLDLALALSVSKLRVYSDSQLVVRHVRKEYEAKDECMARYLAKKPPLAAPLRQANQTAKNGQTTLYNTSDRHFARRSQASTQDPGASRPFHFDWGALVQMLFHRPLYSVPKSFRGPLCISRIARGSTPHSTYAVGDIETNFRPLALRTVGHGQVEPLPAAPAQKKFYLLPRITSHRFRNFCSELNIRNSYSTPRYPQSNGQAEATNKTLINALKKRLEQAKGKWVEELPASCGLIEPHPNVRQETLPSPRIRSDSRRRTYHLLASGSPLQAPPSLQQTHPPALLFALISAAAIFLLFLLNGYLRPELPHFPPQESHLILRLIQAGIHRLLPSLPQLNPPDSLVVPRAVDKLASASSNLKRS